jgi:hypothetical protein
LIVPLASRLWRNFGLAALGLRRQDRFLSQGTPALGLKGQMRHLQCSPQKIWKQDEQSHVRTDLE